MKLKKLIAMIAVGIVSMALSAASAWAQTESKARKNGADAAKAAPKKPDAATKPGQPARSEGQAKTPAGQAQPGKVPPQQEDEEDEEIE